jgi:hypothetical protein
MITGLGEFRNNSLIYDSIRLEENSFREIPWPININTLICYTVDHFIKRYNSTGWL